MAAPADHYDTLALVNHSVADAQIHCRVESQQAADYSLAVCWRMWFHALARSRSVSANSSLAGALQ